MEGAFNRNSLSRKTNINYKPLERYLDFLESENIVEFRRPGKNEILYNDGVTEKVYFLRNEGVYFLKEWNDFKTKFNICEIEEKLK